MAQINDRERQNLLERQIDRLLISLERIQFNEYFEYLSNRRRLLMNHFLSGVARGFGTAIGFTLLGAIVVVILSNLAVDNIPLIGDFLAEVIRVVQERL